ncbi:SDR family oxidoreductase [Actinomadura geliboluensis]|uniref:SDR family oxidoreductase n=1 Tax=Actinomadura geliboluensis TaxID=882440 RepID=UPI00368B8E4A
MKAAGAGAIVNTPPSRRLLQALPIPRWGEPDDVAGTVVYLASDESAYCTGTEILVDGALLSGSGY